MQLYRQHYKTANRALQVRFRQFDPFHRIQYQTGKSGYNTACAAMKHITAPQHLHRYQIPPPRRTLYRAAQPPYYNKVYIRAQRCSPVIDPCQTVQHSADHASPAAVTLWHTPPGGQSSGRGRGGRRGIIDGYRRISFSGFRPIANRGQQ